MRKTKASIIALALTLIASTASYADEKFKVGFVEIGTPTMGWVAANEQGEKYLKEQLPWVDVKTVELINEGPGVTAVLKISPMMATR